VRCGAPRWCSAGPLQVRGPGRGPCSPSPKAGSARRGLGRGLCPLPENILIFIPKYRIFVHSANDGGPLDPPLRPCVYKWAWYDTDRHWFSFGQFRHNCDHCVLDYTVQLSPVMSLSNRPLLDYSRADYVAMRQELSAVDWLQILQGDANEQWNTFISIIRKLESTKQTN